MEPTDRPGPGAYAALDVLLTEAVAGGRPGLPGIGTSGRLVAGLARRPQRVVRRTAKVAAEQVRVLAGTSDLAPAKGDRRFADPAWTRNWALRRTMQNYLAWSAGMHGLVRDAELGWRDEARARFAVGQLVDAVAPTNVPWLNPTVLKESLDRGGENITRGGRRLVRDVAARRLPATVDTSRFEVGGNLAMSEGAIVHRTDLFELIQYAPRTDEVQRTPLLVVPPTINRYYVLDLAPGRSLVEHLVNHGLQVYVISWRNPERAEAHHDLDSYTAAVLEAREVVAQISGQERVGLKAVCSGGIVASCALAHLAATGRLQDSIAHVALLVCLLDTTRAGTSQAMVTREIAAAAVAESARRGYVDGESLARVFAWLRPNDLIWQYVVNNYYLGKPPPAFDVLFWNQDTVRMPAALHRDFLRIAMDNPLPEPGAMEVLGTPVDMTAVDVPAYVVGASTDHIVPWQNAYRSARLLSGETRFVLSASGHIQAIVNPPGPDSRSSFQATEDPPPDADAWAHEAPRHRGSWWEDYVAWTSERGEGMTAAPAVLGSDEHAAAGRAPGTYVHAG